MNAFTTHPSVRIKGTENNYEPVQCVSPSCPNRNPHMHCPFCIKADNYHDPVILKAHYRVKHVDKGIDFAGLKILRCCDHCDIVGTIKGSKEFKGAHWHCYRCRNGFNRRDEAIKHYRTHFRNPQTTFQIQIAQEVNQENYETDNAASTITHISQDENTDGIISSSPLSSTTYTTIHQTEGSQVNGKDGEIQVSVAANETVGAEGQTIMIIQADEHLDASQVQNALNSANIQEVTNIEGVGTVYDTVGHFEEVVEVGISDESNEKTVTDKDKATGGNDENTNNNNNTDGEFTKEYLIKVVESEKHSEDSMAKIIGSRIKKLQNKGVGVEDNNVSSKPDFVPSQTDAHLVSCTCDPYNMYGGCMPHVTANSKESEHPEYGYFPPMEPTRMPQRSRSDVWTATGRYSDYGPRHTIRTSSDLRRYPYNPGFHCNTHKEEFRRSPNPLIAAYQQQNVDIPKSHIQYTGAIEAEKSKWEQKLEDLQQKLNKSEAEHKEREQKLKSEINFLKSRVQSQAAEISALQKREQELLTQLSIPLDSHIHDLLVQLKSQHEDLLHQQLAQVRRAYIQQFGQQAISITTEKASDGSVPSNIVFVQSPGGSNIRLIEEGTPAEMSEEGVSTNRIVIMRADDVGENRSGDSDEEDRQVADAADNGSNELVISTEAPDKVDVNKMEQTAESDGMVDVTETTVLEPVDNETVVQVTLPGTSQHSDNSEGKAAEQGSEKTTDKEVGSPPRSKRRKKSH